MQKRPPMLTQYYQKHVIPTAVLFSEYCLNMDDSTSTAKDQPFQIMPQENFSEKVIIKISLCTYNAATKIQVLVNLRYT